MEKLSVSSTARRRNQWASFTLIELLTVIAIIAILAALVLQAGNMVMIKGMRSRASSEIQAMSTALEGYKTDNGIYPQDSTLTTNTYATIDVAATGAGNYPQAAETLYTALSGQTNFSSTPLSAGKSYMNFKTSQLGNVNASATTTALGSTTYVQDPFRYPYGYSTGSGVKVPYSGTNFFDLWSTGGLSGGSSGKQTNTAAWLANWTQ